MFVNEVYPEAWCNGSVVPIYKQGDKKNVSNYRGITMINLVRKLFSLVEYLNIRGGDFTTMTVLSSRRLVLGISWLIGDMAI